MEIIVPLIFPHDKLEPLRKIADVKIVNNLNEIKNIENISAIIAAGQEISRDFIEKAKNLKIIANYGLGFDKIDIQAAAKKGVYVTIARTAKEEETVADLTLGLIISISRKIHEAHNYVKSGAWTRKFPFIGKDVYNKTLGIIGLGHIGVLVARRAKAFKMKVLYYDIIRRQSVERKMRILYSSLEELLKKSDFVTLHVPLIKETHHLINEERIKLMKKTAYLINVSRGKVVDEEALIKALENNWIAGAALDVFTIEPLPPNSPLLKLENVLLTPHMGGATEECINRVSEVVVKDIIKCLRGKMPTKENIVVAPDI